MNLSSAIHCANGYCGDCHGLNECAVYGLYSLDIPRQKLRNNCWLYTFKVCIHDKANMAFECIFKEEMQLKRQLQMHMHIKI